MRVLVDVRAVVDVPDDTALTPYAMALQDAPPVLFETLTQAGYEVVVHSAPTDRRADPEIERRAQEIYASWSEHPQWVAWVPGGNSVMQDEARSLARTEREAGLAKVDQT